MINKKEKGHKKKHPTLTTVEQASKKKKYQDRKIAWYASYVKGFIKVVRFKIE